MIMSFGRDKAISGIAGGAVSVQDPQLASALAELEKNARSLSWFSIKRLLFYPLTYTIARPAYTIFIGKAFLALLSAVRLLPRVLEYEEKQGGMNTMLHAIPNACAALALEEWKHLKTLNDHRRKLTAYYLQEATNHGWVFPSAIRADLPLQKFPLLVKDARTLRTQLKKQHIYLDDGWTDCVVCPVSCNLASAHYVPGSTPLAEEVANMILSLPTHKTMTLEQAGKLCDLLKKES